MIDDISGEQIDPPGQFFFDLRHAFLVVPQTLLPLVFADLPVPTFFRLLRVLVVALDLPDPVGALALPAFQQAVLAEAVIRSQITDADTIRWTLDWLFLAGPALIDDRRPAVGRRLIAVNDLVFAEGRGHDGPVGTVDFELHVVVEQLV